MGDWDELPLHSLKDALIKSNVAEECDIKVLDKASVSTKFQLDLLPSGEKSNLISHALKYHIAFPQLIFCICRLLSGSYC
jgi:hypothetical protein